MLKPIEIVLRLMPGICGLFWFLFLLLYKGKNNSQKLLAYIALAFSADFLCMGMILSLICNEVETLRCEMVIIVTSLLLFPLLGVYIHSLRREKINGLVIAVSFLPFILSLAILAIISINDPNITMKTLLIDKESMVAYAKKIYRAKSTNFSVIYWALYMAGSTAVAVFTAITLIRNKFKFGDTTAHLQSSVSVAVYNLV